MMLLISGFHTQKNLCEDNPPFEHDSSEIFASPVLDRIILKNISFMGPKTISLPGATNYYPAWGSKLLPCRGLQIITLLGAPNH
jgi:hypothetical protein